MPRSINLKGMRFGKLAVVDKCGKAKNGSIMWLCKCDCGKEHRATTSNLRSGSTNSCGCLRKEVASNLTKTHDLSSTRLHGIWRGMKDRCLNRNDVSYPSYGGRGITICDEWLNDFVSFYLWAIANGYSDKLSIDRIDNNKGYMPSNCRWAECEIQSRNRRSNRRFSYNGKTQTLAEWAREYGIDRKTLSDRMDRFGWSFERALITKAGASYDHRRNKAAI